MQGLLRFSTCNERISLLHYLNEVGEVTRCSYRSFEEIFGSQNHSQTGIARCGVTVTYRASKMGFFKENFYHS